MTKKNNKNSSSTTKNKTISFAWFFTLGLVIRSSLGISGGTIVQIGGDHHSPESLVYDVTSLTGFSDYEQKDSPRDFIEMAKTPGIRNQGVSSSVFRIEILLRPGSSLSTAFVKLSSFCHSFESSASKTQRKRCSFVEGACQGDLVRIDAEACSFVSKVLIRGLKTEIFESVENQNLGDKRIVLRYFGRRISLKRVDKNTEYFSNNEISRSEF